MPLGLFSVVFPNVLFSRDKNIGNGHCPASLTVATHWSVIFSPGDLSWIFPCSLLDCSIAHLQVYLSTWVVAKPTFAAVDWDHVAFAVGKKFKLNQVTFPGGRKNCLSTSLMHRHTTEPRCILMRRYLMHLARIKLNCLPFPVKEPLLIKSQLMMVV